MTRAGSVWLGSAVCLARLGSSRASTARGRASRAKFGSNDPSRLYDPSRLGSRADRADENRLMSRQISPLVGGLWVAMWAIAIPDPMAKKENE